MHASGRVHYSAPPNQQTPTHSVQEPPKLDESKKLIEFRDRMSLSDNPREGYALRDPIWQPIIETSTPPYNNKGLCNFASINPNLDGVLLLEAPPH